MILLKSQKNELFDQILEVGLSPSQFDFEETVSDFLARDMVTVLRFKNSNYYFKFDFRDSQHYSTFSPGNDKLIQQEYPGDWSHQRECVSQWLGSLKREVELPDKWGQIFDSAKQIGAVGVDQENTPFTFVEVQEIQGAAERAKHNISQLTLQEDQFKLLCQKLDYVADKAKTLGRIDWKNLFIGTIVATTVQIALPPETARSLWMLVREAFQKILLITLN